MLYLYRYLFYLLLVLSQSCQKKEDPDQNSGKDKPGSYQYIDSQSDQEAVNQNHESGIVNVPDPEFKKSSELKLTEVSTDKFLLKDAQLVTIEAIDSQNTAEFYVYEICRVGGSLSQNGSCETINYYENSIIYPVPEPGTYQVKILACGRQSLQVGDIVCGEDFQTEFEADVDNRKSKYAAELLEWHELSQRISDLPHKIDQILKEYKKSLIENQLGVQNDEAEKVINNIIKIGPYLHGSYFFDEKFYQFRDRIIQNEQNVKLTLTSDTTESKKHTTSYEYDDNFDTQEKSTFGKVMIIAGLGTIVLGIAKLNNAIGNLKYDRKMEQISELKKDTSAKGVAKVKAAELEATRLNNKTVEGQKRVSRDRKISGGLILGGLFVFATGMGMELATNQISQIRSNMMKQIENLESEYLPVINRYHQLNRILGLNFKEESAESN